MHGCVIDSDRSHRLAAVGCSMHHGSILVLMLAGLVVSGCTGSLSQQSLPPDAGGACEQSQPKGLTAAEFDGWFESGAVSLDGAVKPANSIQFPDDPNCSFYKWSEQMFLWLTSPAPPKYGSKGLVMNTPAFFDVSLPDATGRRHFVPHSAGLVRAFNLRTAQRGILDLPIVLEKGTLRMLEILPPVRSASGNPLVIDGDGKEVEVSDLRFAEGNRPVLLDIGGRDIKAPRALIRSKNDALISPLEQRLIRLERQRAIDRSSLVQKFVFGKKLVLLDLFGHFPETEQGQADGGVLMAQNGSLVYYSIMVNNMFVLFRSMVGAAVPSGTQFPLTQADHDAVIAFATANGKAPVIDSEALAVEIKTSWVEAQGLADASKFIQMKAVIPIYDKSNPDDWVPNGTKTTTLAMVGMHIVGSTGSTNAANSNHGHPEMLWATFEHLSNGPSASYTYAKAPSGSTTIPQDTNGSWLFSANGASAPFNDMHMSMGGPNNDHIVSISPFHVEPSNILRIMPWGLDGTNASGNAQVISINHTVRTLLHANDIRRNYFHEGTTWTIFGGSPSGGNEVGTNRLENTTMETFSQGANCFACHVTNTTVVSHVFDETDPLP